MIRIRVAAVAVGVLVAVAGCSGDGRSDGPSFADRLELLPALLVEDLSSGQIQITMADLDRAAELAGVERPNSTDDAAAVQAYVSAVTGFVPGADRPARVAALLPELAGAQRLAMVGEFAAEVGWSVVDVAWFVEFPVPPNDFAVLGGDFDEGRLTDAMGQPEGDIWRLGGEDGTINPGEISAARPLGQSLRLALGHDRLVVSRTTPPVEAVLAGDGSTLADHPVLSALAVAMDAEEVYSARLVTGGTFVPRPQAGITPAAMAELNQTLLPQPFVGVAAGAAARDGEAFAVLAYAHPDAAAAEQNAEALRRLVEQGESFTSGEPWSALLSVDEIQVDGSTLVARLALREDTPPQLADRILLEQDSLVVHQW